MNPGRCTPGTPGPESPDLPAVPRAGSRAALALGWDVIGRFEQRSAVYHPRPSA